LDEREEKSGKEFYFVGVFLFFFTRVLCLMRVIIKKTKTYCGEFFHINQISEAFCITKTRDEIVLKAKRVKFILMKNNLRVKQYKCAERKE
jgi:hypothetical protein